MVFKKVLHHLPRKGYVPGLRHQKRGELPSMETVRTAVNTACLITNADPELVLSGFVFKAHRLQSHVQLSRARVYAIFALRAVFEEGHAASIAKMVGVHKNPHRFISSYDHAMKLGRLRNWWSDAAFMRVIEAVEVFMDLEQKEKLEAAE